MNVRSKIMVANRKINCDGKYKKYNGITIICPLITNIKKYYQHFDVNVNKNKYSILPLDSMHMTMRNLWTEASFKSTEAFFTNLEEWVPVLQQVQDKLEKYATNVSMEVSGNYVHGLKLKPSSYEDGLAIGVMETLIDDVLYEHPKINQKVHQLVTKHMTLLYSYNDKQFDYMDMLDGTLLPKRLVFGKPQVCLFDSMERYIPI